MDACRSATAGGGVARCGSGPDEWLLLAPEAGRPGACERRWQARHGGLPQALVDVGHRQVALLLDGAGRGGRAQRGLPARPGPSAFPVGMCTRTVLGKAEIVLWRTGADGVPCRGWRSFAAYVRGLLDEAAREFALG